jgi:hypothetical protein
MAEDRWSDRRNQDWDRDRNRYRARPRDMPDYGQADFSYPGPGYGDRTAAPDRRGDYRDEERGFRPFGDNGPIYTASGGYEGEGQPYGTEHRPQRGPDRGYGERHAGPNAWQDRYTPNVREGRGAEPRSWWDRTQDEVSALFGDEEARRRREWDEMRAGHGGHHHGEHRGRGPKGYRRSDARISEDISDRLTDDPYLDASEIEIAVKDAEVTLSGVVFHRDDKRRAEVLAERVSGVDQVQNNLKVQRGGAHGGYSPSTGDTTL